MLIAGHKPVGALVQFSCQGAVVVSARAQLDTAVNIFLQLLHHLNIFGVELAHERYQVG